MIKIGASGGKPALRSHAPDSVMLGTFRFVLPFAVANVRVTAATRRSSRGIHVTQ